MSRRKQSKPIGLIDPLLPPNENDEAISISTITTTTPITTTATTDGISPNPNVNVNEPPIVEDKEKDPQSLVQALKTEVNLESTDLVQELVPSVEEVTKEETEVVATTPMEEMPTVCDLTTEMVTQHQVADSNSEGCGNLKRKRLSYEEMDEVAELQEFPANYIEEDGYDENDDCGEDDDEENEYEIFDGYSMTDDYPLNPDDHHKRIMLDKHNFNNPNHSPLLYNAMLNNNSDPNKPLLKRQNFNNSNDHLNTSELEDGTMVTSMLLMFKCKVCGKGFKHRRSLNRHVKLHSGEKNFHCPYCATAFARSDHLKAHIRTHNNSKPFRCSICQCGYSTQAALKVHIAHHHSKSKFRCVMCNDMEFHSQLALEGHIYKVHTNENSELDLETYDKSEPQLTLVTSRANKIITPQLNPPSSTSTNSNVNFTNSYNRVHMADVNNQLNGDRDTASPDFFNEGKNNNINNLDDNGEMFLEADGENEVVGYNIVQDDEHYVESGNGEENGIIMNGNHESNGVLLHDHGVMEDHCDLGFDNDIEFVENIEKDGSIQNKSTENLFPMDPTNEDPHLDTNSATFIDNYGEDDDQIILDADDHNPPITESDPSKQPKQPINNIQQHKPIQKLPPTLLPAPGSAPTRQTQPRNGNNNMQQQTNTSNTYCEMCNARFSNVESYAAHMRNCHPTIGYHQLPQPETNNTNKMPYLTSILATNTNKQPIVPKVTTPIASTKTKCTIPNCNCSPSDLPQSPEASDSLFTKESHFTCGQCNLTFLKVTDYMHHLKQEHCVEVYRCMLCKQMQLFDNLSLLKEHFFAVHNSTKSDLYRCRLCPPNSSNALFPSMEEMNNHVHLDHRRTVPQQNRLVMPPPNIPIYANANGPTAYNGSPYQRPLPVQNHYHQPYSTKCFKCQYCDSDFAQQNSLNQHIQMVHKNNDNKIISNTNNSPSSQPTTFACQYCRNTFTNRAQLERHVRIHVSSIDLKCNICDKQFTTQDLLSQHKLTHCKTFVNNCEVNKTADTLSDVHVNGGQTSAICVYCKQIIENETQFKEHFKMHNNIGQGHQTSKVNSFICIVCRQTLSSNNEYNLHMRHHLRRVQTNPNPVEASRVVDSVEADKINSESVDAVGSKLRCSKCLVKFEDWRELTDHIAESHPDMPNGLNNGVAPKPANVEVVKEIVEPDMHVHNEPVVKLEKQDTNNSCDIAEIQNGPLNVIPNPRPILQQTPNNQTKPQPGQFNHICEICSSKLENYMKLQAHLLIKHEFGNMSGVFTCPVCDESYSRPDNLLAHANVHGAAARIYKCTQCTLAFVFKSQLINHSFSHHPTQINPQSNKFQKTIHHQQNTPPARQLNPTQFANVINSAPSQTQVHPQPNSRQQVQVNPNYQRPRPQQMQQHSQNNSPMPTHQRFRCPECNSIFDTFKSYQIHNQTFHGRTVFMNNGHGNGGVGGGNNQRPMNTNNSQAFHRNNNMHLNGHSNAPGGYLNGHHTTSSIS